MIVQEITVVEERSTDAFTKRVNQLLSGGWKLSGGMAVVCTVDHKYYFYQSVVREYEQAGAWG